MVEICLTIILNQYINWYSIQNGIYQLFYQKFYLPLFVPEADYPDLPEKLIEDNLELLDDWPQSTLLEDYVAAGRPHGQHHPQAPSFTSSTPLSSISSSWPISSTWTSRSGENLFLSLSQQCRLSGIEDLLNHFCLKNLST